MTLHYLRIAIRHLLKNKINSLVKILGLALGLATTLVVMIVNHSELTWDSFWDDAGHIYKFETFNGSQALSDTTSALVAGALTELAPDAITGRLDRSMIMVSFPDQKSGQMKLFGQSVTRIDDSILDIFSLSTSVGDLARFRKNPTAAIINESVAKKYFGDESPLGKTFAISASQLAGPAENAINGDDQQKIYTIVAVINDVNRRSNEVYQVIIPLAGLDNATKYHSWFSRNLSTYIKIADQRALADIEQRLNKYVAEQIAGQNLQSNIDLKYNAINIADIHLHGAGVSGGTRQLWILYFLALLVLCVTLANHINLTTSSYVGRKKEIVLRRLTGASYWQLFIQFWIEALCHLLLAVLLALMLIEPLIPFIESLLTVRLDNNWLAANSLLVTVFLLLTFISLVIAAYTVWRVAGGSLALVLHANRSRESIGDIKLRRFFYLLQLITGCVLLVCVVIANAQLKKLMNFDPGYNIKNVLFFHGQEFLSANMGQFSQLKAKLEANPNVSSVARSRLGFLGSKAEPGFISRMDQDRAAAATIGVEHLPDFNVLPMFGVPLLAGSLPESTDKFLNAPSKVATNSEMPGGVIICAQTLSLLGYSSASEAVGQSLKFYMGEQGLPLKIIAVTGAIHFGEAFDVSRPCMFWQGQFGSAMSWGISYNNASYQEMDKVVRDIWKEVMGGSPYITSFNEIIEASFGREKILLNFLYAIAAASILISMLGLYGLARLNTQKRQLEITLRKLHGASPGNIIYLLGKEFSLLTLLANVLAWPVAVYLSLSWLEEFNEKIDLLVWIPVACVTALVVSLVLTNATVFMQALAIARRRPAETLYCE